MTDIGVFSLPYQIEDRSWLQTANLESLFTVGVTLQISAFTAATHYPNGYIPSGTVLGLITAQSTGGALVVGPYDDTAADGRQVAQGILFSAVRVWNPLGAPLTKVGAASLVAWGVVSSSKLPFNSSNASTGRGYIDAAGQVDLPRLHFVA